MTGQVVDAASKAPIGQVQVYLQGTSIGTLSRQDGQFMLLNVPAGTHTLRAERIGMSPATREVTVGAGEVVRVDFELSSQALGLDEIVVTGTAGASRRREVGNTIAQISADAIPDRPAQVSDMLQSAAPGIDVSAMGGEVGQGQQIRLRGNSSVSMSNQPIIYIDGIRMQSEAFPHTSTPEYRAGRGANVTASPLNNINPNDIERIEVIKGSAATTLYGTEASAGVIQIFTKRGTQGAPVWTVETQQGAAWSRKFGTPEFPYLRIDPWLRTAYTQQYFGSVRGGGQDLQYFVSGQFADEEGVLPLDVGTKWVVRSNFTFTPISDLQLQSNSSYTQNRLTNTPSGNNAQGLTLSVFRGDANYFGSLDPEKINQVLTWDLNTEIESFTTGGTATYSPLANQTNRLTVGYEYNQQEVRNLRPYGFVFFPQGGLDVNIWQNRLLTLDYVGTLSFGLTEGIRSSFSWGGQAVGDETRQFETWGEGFPGAKEPTVNSASINMGFEERQRVWNAGFFVQNVLDLRDKYFLTLGMRVDGHSAFGSDFGVQPYPKASFSWVVSDEGWWNESWGQVKLRTAYGQSGRAPGAFDAVRTWQPAGLRGEPAFVPQNVGNPDLGPEVTAELEFGFDGSWLEDRLRSTFTFYRQRTTDALFNVAQIPSQGFIDSQLKNVGELKNAGIEFSVDASPVQRANWGWDVGLNISTNASEVVSLGEAPAFSLGGNGWVVEGQPVPVVRGFHVTNPDAIADPIIEENYNYGPNQPTRTVGVNSTLRLPAGISLSARGEYRGGHFISINPSHNAVSRSVKWPQCWPYYTQPGETVELKADTPALWRARCTPSVSRADYFIHPADFFRLRSVSAQIPVDFLVPSQINSAVLTLALNNSWSWFKDFPVFDPEMQSNQGAHEQVVSLTERVPSPISFRTALRITF